MLAHNDDKVITPIYRDRVDFWGIHHKSHTIVVNTLFKNASNPAPLLASKPLPPWKKLKNTFVMSLNF